MSKFIKRGFSLLLALCLLQCVFVPNGVTAASAESMVYDFYTPYKSYTNLFHWRTEAEVGSIAQSQIARDFESGKSNWMVLRGNGYANMMAAGYVSINMGQTADCVFRFRSPGTGNYEVDINYVTTNANEANIAAEFIIIPADKPQYSSAELTDLLSQYRAQKRLSLYDASASVKKKSTTIAYSFLEGQDYLFVVRGGCSYVGATTSRTYLRNLTARRVGEYNPPKEPEYPRPVTVLEEALTRWKDDFHIVTEVNDEDYLAVPIYGGKMYIINLDTWQLVDEVNTGIEVPRGITADDNGVIYLVGTSYTIYTYDLKTNKTGKSSRFNGDGVSLGSTYDISFGEDKKLYFGTDKGHIIRYDPLTDTSTSIKSADYGISNATYVSSVIQQGQYIYAAVTTNAWKHYLVKLDKDTFEVIGKVDYTSTGPATYMSHMSITEDGIILGGTKSLMAIDTNEMRLLTADEFGTSAPIQCYVSEEINGKHYYVSNLDRCMYRYDPEAEGENKVTKLSGIGQFFDCQGKTVTFDKNGDGVDERYLLAIENPRDYDIKFVNPETGEVWSRKIPLDKNAGASTGVNSLTSGSIGSNELYYGGFTSNQVIVYNTDAGKITGQIAASGIQTDAIYVDGDTIYGGNYTEAQLTRLHRDTNKPEVLMTLHNSLFNQSRIHSITGGDNKLFFGTFPYVYKHGGVLAWYDLTTNRSYVAVGPEPTDVYYANYEDTKYNYTAQKPTVPVSSVRWYNEVTGEQLTGFDEWTGIVDYQGVKEVAYHDGIIYAATSIAGGTNTSPISGTSAVVFAYDVAARKIIATFDPAQYGFKTSVPTISGIELDEKGNLWCVVSETLFTLTLNADNTFTYNEKLSFDKYGYDATQNRNNSDIRFKDGYVYVAFERVGGLCKVNMANPSDYTMLLPNVVNNGDAPDSFAFGEDGNLYYLNGTSLEILTLDPAEDEWVAARAVTEQISAITSATITQTRQAYEQLTLRQKSLVQNYDDLVQAEVNALMQDIVTLGDVTLEKREQVQALLAVYKQMPKSQQNKVTNYYILANANQRLQMLEKDYRIIAINDLDEECYFKTLEEALAATTKGTIRLYGDVMADTVILRSGITLDLNGCTLTAKYMFAMNGAMVLDGGAKCTGGGLLKIEKDNLVLAENNGDCVIPVWNGTDGYIFTRVTFQQIAKPVGSGASQYIFLPSMSNPEAAALLADGGLDNGVQIKVSLIWNNGQSQQLYTYEDNLVEQVFASGGRLVFSLTVTGIADITNMVANPVVITDCGAQATIAGLQIENYQPLETLEYALGYMEIVGF